MPELPELEVVAEVLQRRVVGQTVAAVEVLPPGGAIVLRDLTGYGVATLVGAACSAAVRRDQFICLTLERPGDSAPLYLVVNPKLMGRLQLAAPQEKRHAKTHLVITLGNDEQLRYFDAKTMGQIYLTGELERVPGYVELGPEPLGLTLEEFRARLRPFRGEIKGILVRAEFVAGIGNAYADEILWAARLHPYRKRTQLTDEETERLYVAMRTTLLAAIEHVRQEMGEAIHREPRGFLQVHLRGGQPCPRCGAPISQVSANQRITNFCRTCQPGGLIRGM
jgi:formamidopyrimidine-DNA glycosylase